MCHTEPPALIRTQELLYTRKRTPESREMRRDTQTQAKHPWDFGHRFVDNISILCTERIHSKRKLKNTILIKSSDDIYQPSVNIPEI